VVPFRKLRLDHFAGQAVKANTRNVMKNRRSSRCLVVNENPRTNLVGSSAQAPKYLRGLVHIRWLTDNFILQRDERIGCEHHGIGTCLRDGHSLTDGIPERELA